MLAAAMRTDDAIATAYETRLAPQRCLAVAIEPAKAGGARAKAIAGEADALFGQDGVGVSEETLADIHGCLIDHGVAFGVNVAAPREDGSRIDFQHCYWPIEFVRWDETQQCFFARVDPQTIQPGDIPSDGPGAVLTGVEVPIVHGDGRWTIYKKHEWRPFTKEAALLAAALVWARHAFTIRDWAKGSVSHGSAKVVGKLPEQIALQGEAGGLSAEASAFLDLLRSLVSDDAPFGIAPAGSEVDFMVNTSTAWQVWSELANNAEKAAARIYLGTDGTLGTQGGAPGVNIEALFGVATTRVQGDLWCIQRCFKAGVIDPWCAVNFGDSSLAPKRVYLFPDEDESARDRAFAERNAAFGAALKALVDARIPLSQPHVDELAASYRVPAPMLPASAPAAAPAPAPPDSPEAAPAPVTTPALRRITRSGA